MAVGVIGLQPERPQQAGDGMLAVIDIGECQRQADQVVGVLRIETDRLLADAQRVLHAIGHAVERAEIGIPGCHAGLRGHRTLQQRDAAFRIIGVGGDHAEQGDRRRVVRRGREHVVADAGGLAEAPGLCRGLRAGEGLIRRLGRDWMWFRSCGQYTAPGRSVHAALRAAGAQAGDLLTRR